MGPPNTRQELNIGCKDEERLTLQQCSVLITTVRKSNIGNVCISIIRVFQKRRDIFRLLFFYGV